MRSLRPNNSGRRSQHVGPTAKEPERDGQDRISELDDAVAETAMKRLLQRLMGPTERLRPADDVREVWGAQSRSRSMSNSQQVTEQRKGRTGYDLRPS